MIPTCTRFPLRVISLAGVCAIQPALATEAGVDNIGPGTDGFFMLPLSPDSLPANMLAFNLYYNHYTSTKLNISSLGGKVPDVDIESTAVIPRLDYLSPLRVFGGRVAGYIAQPWLKQEVAVFGLHDTREGMGDTTVAPIILWDMGPNLTLGAALEITVPTGEYSVDRLANTSNNFYTYKPLFSFTWLPSENTEMSMKTTYSFNGKNKDTDYESGQIFHFDYSASYKITENLMLGLNGYYLKQTTDDKQFDHTVQFNGQDVNDGVRGQVSTIRPSRTANKSPNCNNTDSVWVGLKNT